MIDQRFMQSLADDMKDPMLGEETAPDTMLAAGPVTSDVPQTGVRLGRAGVTPQQSAKAGGLDRPAMALLDTLAGALHGATSQVIGLPGDIRSIIDAINQEGAEKYLGKRVMPTTEEVQAALPSVVPQGVANQAEREFTAKTASDIGTFLPAPGIPEAVVKGGKMIGRAVQATKNMPVGMSTQMVGEGVSDLGFYSAAKQAVDSIQQLKGTGDQFLKQIEKTPGVKPEEIKWTGLDDFLKSKKSVTKAEVQEFLDKNRVEIKEVQLGEPTHEWQGNFLVINKTAVAKIDEAADGSYVLRDNINEKTIPLKSNRLDKAVAEAEDIYGVRGMVTPYEDKPKFSKYTLPGGENYREILITLPSKNQFDPEKVEIVRNRQSLTQGSYTIKYDNKVVGTFSDDFNVSDNYKGYSDEQIMNHAKSLYEKGSRYSGIEPMSNDFISQHFDQPNILAHMRVNDRVDADGKKVLFIEEVQSDWHQAGRKKGYQNPKIEKEIADIQSQMNAMAEIRDPVTNQIVNEKEWFALGRKKDELAKQIGFAPNAPFKTTWHELAMKRAIQLAAEGGYDRVAFTTGKTQAERYSLSKQVDKLTASHLGGERYRVEAIDKAGNPAIIKVVESENELDSLIGKEFARKIVDETKGKTGSKTYSGLELDVGGEGMKGFYDQILPKFLDKYAKKWDAKTGMTKIQTESKAQAMADANLLEELGTPRDKIDTSGMVSVQYIDVTPKMKESVLTKGQPLFAIGAGGAAVQQEENQ